MLPQDRWLAVVRDAPLVSIDLILCNTAGEILLGLRRNEPARDTWFVPGGVIRKGERREQAFGRIAEAELGYRPALQQARFVGVFEHHYERNFAEAPGFGTHYVVLAYRLDNVRLPDGLPLDQHRELRWFAPAALRADPRVHEYTKAYFKDEHP